MKKKIISVAMLVVVLVSSLSFSAFAASSRTVYVPTGHNWSADVTCTLSNKRKDAKVRATMNNYGRNLDVRMKNGSKVIWSQNNAIKAQCGPAYIYRDFTLGKNYSCYKLSFRDNQYSKLACEPSVTVSNRSNCNIS